MKKLAYYIENSSNRKWEVESISQIESTKNYQYIIFHEDSFHKNRIVLMKNIYAPILAFAEPNSNFEFANRTYSHCAEMEGIISNFFVANGLKYELLPKDLLNSKYSTKEEFEDIFEKIDIAKTSYPITVEKLKAELHSFRLFYGENIGYELFNNENSV